MSVLKTTLRDLRKSKGLQQADLAALVGVRRETIGNLENGKYNPSFFSQMTHVIAPLSKIVAQM